VETRRKCDGDGKAQARPARGSWIAASALVRQGGRPFYGRLNTALRKRGLDEMVEGACARYYAEKTGRPSIPPVANAPNGAYT